jgi:hypothetical protein
MLTPFFKDLGTRLSNENTLSDITWALAQNSKNFFRVFIDLFEFRINLEKPCNITREYQLNSDSRPDLAIEYEDGLFIIECKIEDTNDHMEQYYNASKGQKIVGYGFIANYSIAPKNNFVATTWKELTNRLNEYVNSGGYFDQELEKDLIMAYITYVKGVCNMVELGDIKGFENLTSLFYFNNLIKEIISEFPPDGYETSVYNSGKPFRNDRSGIYFSLNKKGRETTIYPWIGIWYGDKNLCIFMDFEQRWNVEIYNYYKGKKEKTATFHYYTNKDDMSINFELEEQKFKEFTQSKLDKQKEILKIFFQEVTKEIGQYF